MSAWRVDENAGEVFSADITLVSLEHLGQELVKERISPGLYSQRGFGRKDGGSECHLISSLASLQLVVKIQT